MKFTSAKGSETDDPSGVFTGGFGGKRRVIDLFEDDEVEHRSRSIGGIPTEAKAPGGGYCVYAQ